MVTFDVTSIREFDESLSVLDKQCQIEINQSLLDITIAKMNWGDFVRDYKWAEIERVGQQTYPGADPMYFFVLPSAIEGRSYQVAAVKHKDHIVICMVARIEPKPIK